jgi:predicted DCC family thiol-disulfide oxidoreductase YuxK
MPNASVMPAPSKLVEEYRSQIEGYPILLFDGVCVFCNRTVQFLLRRDRDAILRFVPLESPLGEQLLARVDAIHSQEGIVLITEALTDRERISRRTDAFSDALSFLPSIWRITGKVLRLVPRGLRELAYNFIVHYRYRLFGGYESCPVPAPEQRARILGISS